METGSLVRLVFSTQVLDDDSLLLLRIYLNSLKCRYHR